MKNKKLSDSFKNAYNGLKLAMSHERNMRIHFIAAISSVVLGIILGLDTIRWALLMVANGMVLAAELLNTAVEKMTDMITSNYSEDAKAVKDMAAGAVLAASVAAAAIGALIFLEPFIRLLDHLF
jgi:undecaprenol kinase